jgi:thymidine kinase
MDNKFLIYGCMFAGKTTKLHSLTKFCPKPYKIIVHKLHNRFKTHDGRENQFSACESLPEILEAASGAEILFIDEIQFFDLNTVTVLLNRPETIYFSGLDTDFMGRDFPTTAFLKKNILPDNITRLRAICRCGGNAIYTKLKVLPPAQGNILIGAENEYEPACLKCLKN